MQSHATSRRTPASLAACAALLALALPAAAQLNTGTPKELEGIEVEQKLGAPLPLDLKFRDETGREVALREYFDGTRPVLLTFNYYRCPMLCGFQLNGLLEALKDKGLQWTPGQEFRIVTVGFDPLEGPDLAAAKKRTYMTEYGRPDAAAGWRFLTGEVDSIRAITAACGFKYRWNAEQNEWAHAACLIVASPDGKICRYFGGIVFDAPLLRLSMVEASQGKVGSLWDQVFLTCFHWSSSDGKYVPFAMGMMRVGGALTVLILGAALAVFWVRDLRRRRVEYPMPPASQAT